MNLLGCTLPRTLLPANTGNDRGYWESPLVTKLNDEVLALAGANWRGLQYLRDGRREQAALRALKSKALTILESEFGNAQLFVLKDPRICRLLGFWREVLDDFGAKPVAACPIRNPLEVAASLEKRNGLVPALGHLIWLRYALDAELGTRPMPRTFTTYDALLDGWRPVVDRMAADLGIAWPRSPQVAAAEIDAFLSPSARHHVIPVKQLAGDPELPEWPRATYTILERWARTRERRADFAALDRIRRGMDEIPAAVLPVIAASEAEVRRLRKRIDRHSDELERRDAEAQAGALNLQEAKAHLEEMTRNLALREADAVSNSAQLAEVKAKLGETARLLARRDAEESATAAQLREARSQLTDSARRLAQKDADGLAHAAQLTELRSQLAAAARQLAENDADIEAKTQELQEARSRLAETALELARRYAESYSYSEQLKALRAQYSQTAGDLARRETEAEAGNARLGEAKAESQRLRAELGKERKGRATLQAAFDGTQKDLSRSRQERDDALLEAKHLDAELRRIRSSAAWRLAQTLGFAPRAARAILRYLRIPSRAPAEKTARLLAASDLFDRKWYSAQYSDVSASGMDPALHYVRHGAAEGRDPGPNFSTRWYLEAHKDVAEAGFNPLLHYLLHGREEGREIERSSAAAARPAVPAVPTEPAAAAADPLSRAPVQATRATWLQHRDLSRKAGLLSLELSGLMLGTTPVERKSPADVWTAIGAAAEAVVIFCRAMGKDAREALRCYAGDSPFDLGSRLDTPTGPPEGPVASFESCAAGVAVVDIWYVNDRDLRLRFARARTGVDQAFVARFFQYDLSSDRLLLAGESLLGGCEAEFADVAMMNPFSPVLMTLTSPDAQLLSASLLPFPSLCRGGVHYGELCAVGREASYLENLRTVSRGLLAEMLGGALAFSVARVEVDLQGAIGSERMFSTDIREWLAAVMHVAVRPANASADDHPKTRSHLERGLAAVPVAHRQGLAERIAARERAGVVGLTVPADGVPTLHGLVSRRLGVGAGKARVGSFVMARSSTATPRWSVTLPPMGEELLALQPANAGIGFPVITRLSPGGEHGVRQSVDAAPLAVQFFDSRGRHAASLIMPVAPDAPGPLLRTNGNGEAATISVILASRGDGIGPFAALLDSLRLQSVAGRLEIVAIADRANAGAREGTEKALRRFFPDKYRLVDLASGGGHSERINRAAEHATGRFLLIVGADVALHDPRTLQTLRVMADPPNVASAGCVLLQTTAAKKGPVPALRSGGIFLSRGSSADPSDAVFSERDCLEMFPLATYPVAANSSALFMARSDVWRTLGGFDARAFPDARADIDYGVRAIARGFQHLCTSVISAELRDQDFRKAYSEEPLAAQVPGASRREIPSSAGLVEALKA